MLRLHWVAFAQYTTIMTIEPENRESLASSVASDAIAVLFKLFKVDTFASQYLLLEFI